MRPQDHDRPDATVALTAAGVTVLIDAGGGRLPAIVHWGHELPALNAEQAAALVAASVPVIGSNNVELAPRVAVLPEQHTGWSGKPGLRGSFAGRGWSPAFTTRSVSLDGGAVSGHRSSGPGAVEILAVDDTGRLQLRLVLELLASGLFRARASVTNLAAEPYSLEELVVSFPVPAEAAELLDFAGRHNLERVPQRQPFRTGVDLRGNRKGRTGADSAYVLHAHPGSASPAAMSGRSTPPGAATTSTTPSAPPPASSSSAAASCSCPARSGWPRATATRAPGSTGPTARGWTRSPGGSTGTCGTGSGRSRPTARCR
jgi:hypothetical protein